MMKWCKGDFRNLKTTVNIIFYRNFHIYEKIILRYKTFDHTLMLINKHIYLKILDLLQTQNNITKTADFNYYVS